MLLLKSISRPYVIRTLRNFPSFLPNFSKPFSTHYITRYYGRYTKKSEGTNTPHPPKDPPENYKPNCIATEAFKVPVNIQPLVFREMKNNEILGPDASKEKAYKNPEYYAYHRYSQVDLFRNAMRIRNEREKISNSDSCDEHKKRDKQPAIIKAIKESCVRKVEKIKTNDCKNILKAISSKESSSKKEITKETKPEAAKAPFFTCKSEKKVSYPYYGSDKKVPPSESKDTCKTETTRRDCKKIVTAALECRKREKKAQEIECKTDKKDTCKDSTQTVAASECKSAEKQTTTECKTVQKAPEAECKSEQKTEASKDCTSDKKVTEVECKTDKQETNTNCKQLTTITCESKPTDKKASTECKTDEKPPETECKADKNETTKDNKQIVAGSECKAEKKEASASDCKTEKVKADCKTDKVDPTKNCKTSSIISANNTCRCSKNKAPIDFEPKPPSRNFTTKKVPSLLNLTKPAKRYFSRDCKTDKKKK